MDAIYNTTSIFQKTIFKPFCTSCQKPAQILGLICNDCHYDIQQNQFNGSNGLYRHKGAIVGLVASLKNDYSLLAQNYILANPRLQSRMEWLKSEGYNTLVPVPSKKVSGVYALFRKIAIRHGLIFAPVIGKLNRTQKEQSVKNRYDGDLFFHLISNNLKFDKAILIDDISSTKTSLDQCKYILRRKKIECFEFTLTVNVFNCLNA